MVQITNNTNDTTNDEFLDSMTKAGVRPLKK